MRARESDFEGPLGVYLILDVTDLQTGEMGLLSCSSPESSNSGVPCEGPNDWRV